MSKDIVYFCEQGDPYCVHPKCVCNTVRPKKEIQDSNPKEKFHSKIKEVWGSSPSGYQYQVILEFIDKCSLSDFEKLNDLKYDADEEARIYSSY